MDNDDRTFNIFTPVSQIESELRNHSPEAQKRIKIKHFRQCIAVYDKEKHWKRYCTPNFLVLCLIPLLWPLLVMRSTMSKAAQHAMRQYLESVRDTWQNDLGDVGGELNNEPTLPAR
jgi:hypothetical protein